MTTTVGNYKRGTAHPRAVLDHRRVRKIRQLSGQGLCSKCIALLLHLNYQTVHDVVRGRTWRHVN